MGKIAFLSMLVPLAVVAMPSGTTAQAILNAPKRPPAVISGIPLPSDFAARINPAPGDQAWISPKTGGICVIGRRESHPMSEERRDQIFRQQIARGCFIGREALQRHIEALHRRMRALPGAGV